MRKIFVIIVLLNAFVCSSYAQTGLEQKETKKPSIELVFCLDATGSMSGLIRTAKEKIWEIVSVMSQTNPTPKIKLGFIFYRDITDEFITKTYPLTENIDSVYSQLLLIEAQGGGDTPESVNQALNEAVQTMNWSESAYTYRTIFLVGDCPPHMDYQQDVKYETSCKIATKKQIIINTIKLGVSCTDAIMHFQNIASMSKGEYIALGQNADDVIINTPYDDSILYYSNSIDRSKIYYGTEEKINTNQINKDETMNLYKHTSKNALADRASFNVSETGKENFFGVNELIQDIILNKVVFDSIPEDQLPPTLKKLSKSERKIKITELVHQRTSDFAHLLRLTKERDLFIQLKKKEMNNSNTFSSKIYEIVKKQALTFGIVFKN